MPLFGPNIVEMQKTGDIQGLMRALGDSKPEIACKALDALIGLSMAPELLMAAIQKKAWPFWLVVARRLDAEIDSLYIRSNKEFSIGAFGRRKCLYSGRFVQPLLAALQEGTDEVKASALEGLKKLDKGLLNPPGTATLIKLAEGLLLVADTQTRAGAVAVLDAAGWSPRVDELGLLYWLEKRDVQALVRLGVSAVELLSRALTSSLKTRDRDRAVTAATALGQLGDTCAVEALTTGIGSLAETACVEALGHIDSPAVNETLLSALKNGHALEGNTLKQALLRKGPTLVERALELVGELGTTAKRVVLDLCAEMDVPGIVQHAAAFMLDPALRAEAVAVLTKFDFHPSNDEGSLEYCLETGDFEHLVESGANAVPVLSRRLATADSGQLESLICTLVRIGPPSCNSLVECLKETSDTHLEQAIMDALSGIGGEFAFAALEQLLASNKKMAKVVLLLDSLGFQPHNDAAGAAYYEEKANWLACIETGPDGVARIVQLLLEGDRYGIGATLNEQPFKQRPLLIAELEKALERKSTQAASSLDALGWKPRQDETGARYWLAKENIEMCANIGMDAYALLAEKLETAYGEIQTRVLTALGGIPNPEGIALLAKHLTSYSQATRVAAAQAIVKLCKSCTLSEKHKLEVLQLRSTITKPHSDGRFSHKDIPYHYDHTSWASASDCNSGSFSSHTDNATQRGYGTHKDVSAHTDEGIGLAFPF